LLYCYSSSYQSLIQGSANIVENQVIRNWDVVEFDIAALKMKRITEVNQARDALINAGVNFNEQPFDSDASSRANITATAASIGLGESLPEGFFWRNANNEDITMDAETFRAFAMTVFGHVYAIHMAARIHKDAINALDTAQAVATYSIIF